MHIVHSALRHTTSKRTADWRHSEIEQRLAAYQATCYKYRQEIAEIQQYLPGWQPLFDPQHLNQFNKLPQNQ